MPDEKILCNYCQKATSVYSMVTMYHCQKCNLNVCLDCLPKNCVQGKLFKKYLCPKCGERMRYIEKV